MNALSLTLVSTIGLAGNSLAASHYFKGKERTCPFVLSFYSFLPAFAVALVCLPLVWDKLSAATVASLFLKDCLYGIAFFLRFEALKKFGAFVGALLLGIQPIFVSALSYGMLGEQLAGVQVVSVLLAGFGLYLLASQPGHQPFNLKDILFCIFLPAVLMALVMVLDRHSLTREFSGIEFFIADKVLLLPAFVVSLIVLQPKMFRQSFRKQPSRKEALKLSMGLGALWLISSFFYGLALDMEKTAVVSMLRNLSYPLAALLGAVLFRERVTRRQGLGFALVTFGGILVLCA